MFQPGEEVMAGAKAMIDAGVLENPKVDAAFSMHFNLFVTYDTVSGSFMPNSA